MSLNLATKTILRTDMIIAYQEVVNYNTELFKSTIETVVNGLNLDATTKKIGLASNLLENIYTKSIYIEGTGFDFQYSASSIASLTRTAGNLSRFNVDIAVVDSELTVPTLDVGDIQVNATSTFSGAVDFNSNVGFEAAPTESFVLSDVIQMEKDVDIGKYVFELNKSTRQTTFFVLDAQSHPSAPIWNGSSWNISGNIIIYIDFDSVNPPQDGQCFTFSIKDIVNSVDTSLQVHMTTKNIYIAPEPSSGIEIPKAAYESYAGIKMTSLQQFFNRDSSVTLQYINDTDDGKQYLVIKEARNATAVTSI